MDHMNSDTQNINILLETKENELREIQSLKILHLERQLDMKD